MDSLEIAPKLRILFGMGKKTPDVRRKILERGEDALSNTELMAILLGRPSKTNSIASLSHKALRCIDKNKHANLLQELKQVKGLASSKIAIIAAALELGKRYYGTTYEKITTPTDVLPYLKQYENKKVEHFISISLSGAHEIINIRVVSVGTLMRTLAHPREVFADIITDRAASVIFAHNHPSGNCEPSDADLSLTHNLVDAGDILGIEVLDHIIFARRGEYLSLAESGIISSPSIASIMS